MPADLAPSPTLLAADDHPGGWDVASTVVSDRPGRGAVAVRVGPGRARRLEPGPLGPVLFEARSDGRRITCELWGPPATPRGEVETLMEAARGWAGCRDSLDGYAAVASAHPVVAEMSRRLGPVRLSALPRVCEALGRSVLGQLVQAVEARRSMVQVAALVGQAGPAGLWTWPDAARLEPFRGHRGRVARRLMRAAALRLVERPERRSPRAALSAPRYW